MWSLFPSILLFLSGVGLAVRVTQGIDLIQLSYQAHDYLVANGFSYSPIPRIYSSDSSPILVTLRHG